MYKFVAPREGVTMGAQTFKPTDDSKIIRRGTFTVTYPLTGPKIQEWYTMVANSDLDPDVNKALDSFTEDYDPEDNSKQYNFSDHGWYAVMPNTTQGSYTLTVSVNRENKTATVPAEFMHWLPGYSYTYVFKINEDGGVEIGWVDYAVTPWADMTSDWPVYNW